jgi:hypothetical protein
MSLISVSGGIEFVVGISFLFWRIARPVAVAVRVSDFGCEDWRRRFVTFANHPNGIAHVFLLKKRGTGELPRPHTSETN